MKRDTAMPVKTMQRRTLPAVWCSKFAHLLSTSCYCPPPCDVR